jgi:hypothetical protein
MADLSLNLVILFFPFQLTNFQCLAATFPINQQAIPQRVANQKKKPPDMSVCVVLKVRLSLFLRVRHSRTAFGMVLVFFLTAEVEIFSILPVPSKREKNQLNLTRRGPSFNFAKWPPSRQTFLVPPPVAPAAAALLAGSTRSSA